MNFKTIVIFIEQFHIWISVPLTNKTAEIFRIFLLLILNIFHIFFWCLTVDFEQVNVVWEYFSSLSEMHQNS